MRLASISARRAGHLFGSFLLARLAASLLASVLVTLVPLAHFSPPDPTWIAGLYDDADHDDAVVAIDDAIGFLAPDGTTTSPATPSSARVAFVGSTRPDASSRIRPVDRAPPHR